MKSNYIKVISPDGQKLNGLASMVLQYLKQDLAEYDFKALAAQKIHCSIGMQVEGSEAAITTFFFGDRIVVENGIAGRVDLHLEGPYMLLADILCGRANPFVSVLQKKIRLKSFPKRPIQSLKVLSLLKIPKDAKSAGPAELDDEI